MMDQQMLDEDFKRNGYYATTVRKITKLEALVQNLFARVGLAREVLRSSRTYYVRADLGTCNISIATPAVITLVSHGLQADDPVVFRTSGALPTGLTAGTVYYVISTGLTTDYFQVSTTVGGAAVNTSGVQSGVHTCATGNDSNNGLVADRTGAFITMQAAADVAYKLDANNYTVTIQCARSKYLVGVSFVGRPPLQGSARIQFVGDNTTPSNCDLSTTSADCIVAQNYAWIVVNGFKLSTTTSGSCIFTNVFAYLTINGNMEFGACATHHIWVSGMSTVQRVSGNKTISGGATTHYNVDDLAWLKSSGGTTTLTGTPGFFRFANASRLGEIVDAGTTYSGAATGQRYFSQINAVINTAGGGANYFPGNAAGATATGGQYV